MSMQCEQAETRLAELAAGEPISGAAGDPMLADAAAHVESCDACREKLADLRLTLKLLADGFAAEAEASGEVPTLSADRRAKLEARFAAPAQLVRSGAPVDDPGMSGRFNIRNYLRPLGVAASFGLVAIGAWGLMNTIQGQPAFGPVSGYYSYADEAASEEAIGSARIEIYEHNGPVATAIDASGDVFVDDESAAPGDDYSRGEWKSSGDRRDQVDGGLRSPESRIDQLEAEKAQLQAQLGDKDAEIQRQNAEVVRLSTQNADYDSNVARLSTSLDKHNEINGMLESELAERREKQIDAEKRLVETNAALRNRTTESETLASQTRMLTEELDDLKSNDGSFASANAVDGRENAKSPRRYSIDEGQEKFGLISGAELSLEKGRELDRDGDPIDPRSVTWYDGKPADRAALDRYDGTLQQSQQGQAAPQNKPNGEFAGRWREESGAGGAGGGGRGDVATGETFEPSVVADGQAAAGPMVPGATGTRPPVSFAQESPPAPELPRPAGAPVAPAKPTASAPAPTPKPEPAPANDPAPVDAPVVTRGVAPAPDAPAEPSTPRPPAEDWSETPEITTIDADEEAAPRGLSQGLAGEGVVGGKFGSRSGAAPDDAIVDARRKAESDGEAKKKEWGFDDPTDVADEADELTRRGRSGAFDDADERGELNRQMRELKSQQLAAKGKAAAEAGQYDLAEDSYKQAQAIDPDNPTVANGLKEVEGKDTGGSTLPEYGNVVGLRAAQARAQHDKALKRAEEARASGNLNEAIVAETYAKAVLDRNRQYLTESEYQNKRDATLDRISKIESTREQMRVDEVTKLEAERIVTEDAESDALPAASNFKLVPVNPFVLTARDRFSTFGLDTDSASYALARKYVRAGFRPPAGAIRMEEFVNAFDYNYANQSDRVFTVHAEAGEAPYGENLTLLKVGVKAKTIGRENRKPAHLVFVIDASGSMDRPDRLPLVKHSLALLVNQLGPADRVSIVAYGTKPILAAEAASASNAKPLLESIHAIQAGGSTNMVDALTVGYNVARNHFKPGEINRVILCSDGVANVGSTDAQQMLDKVAANRAQGITLTNVGFGIGGYNDALMTDLAKKGDGNYVFVDTTAEAKRLFVDQLASTLQTVAKDAKIQVEFDPTRVRRYRLIGYERRDIADADFRNDTVDAGEVGSGQSATALYEVELLPAAAAGNDVALADLGTVFVCYQNVETGEVEEISSRLRTDLIRERTPERDPRFYLAACAAEYAEILRGSEFARSGSLESIERRLVPVVQQLPLDRQASELLDLVRRTKGLPAAP